MYVHSRIMDIKYMCAEVLHVMADESEFIRKLLLCEYISYMLYIVDSCG